MTQNLVPLDSAVQMKILDHLAAGVMAVRIADGAIIYANPAMERMFGYGPGGLIGHRPSVLNADDGRRDPLAVYREITAALTASGSWDGEILNRRKDGSPLWCHARVSTVALPHTGDVWLGVHEDISRRKAAEAQVEAHRRDLEQRVAARTEDLDRANRRLRWIVERRAATEQALRRSEREKALILGTISDIVLFLGRDLTINWANRAAQEATGLDPKTMAGRKCHDVFHGRAEPCPSCPVLHSFTSGMPRQAEREDGAGRHWRQQAYPVYGEGGGIEGAVEVAQEITSAKRMENDLRRSVAEKEILLREIHHRVKNNLNVIISLIDMQRDRNRSDPVRRSFAELRERIRAIALVHEDLYAAQNLSEINMAVYLEKLAGDMLHLFDAGGVVLDLDVDPLPMTVDRAIPCGLIVTELLTNAIKYARPEGKGPSPGPVKVSVTLKADDTGCRLVVRDDGPGLPKDLDWRRTKSLGLRLVNILARQLRGDVRMNGRKGVWFELTIPHDPGSGAGTGSPAEAAVTIAGGEDG